jgi:LysM repeat protein
MLEDRTTTCAYPTPAHRCYRNAHRAPVSIEHQSSYCLSTAHLVCPVYRGASNAPPRDRRRRALSHAWPVLAALSVAGIALLVSGAVVVTGRESHSAPATPAAASRGSATAEPSITLSAALAVPPAGSTASPTNATPSPPSAVRYIVQPGDNLTEIAAYFGSRNDDIIRMNRLPADGRILAGQELVIPVGP